MREILFRGKRTDNGEWVEGYYSPLVLPIFGEMAHYINEAGYKAVEVIPETVGQYTGLTDKNGRKIFEGDIIKNEYEKGHYQYFKIYYCCRLYMWQVQNQYGCGGKLYQTIGTIEVIGNIHDNPELLKEGGKKDE